MTDDKPVTFSRRKLILSAELAKKHKILCAIRDEVAKLHDDLSNGYIIYGNTGKVFEFESFPSSIMELYSLPLERFKDINFVRIYTQSGKCLKEINLDDSQ